MAKKKQSSDLDGMRVGEQRTIERNGRLLTFERRYAFGKRKKLRHVIVKNEKA